MRGGAPGATFVKGVWAARAPPEERRALARPGLFWCADTHRLVPRPRRSSKTAREGGPGLMRPKGQDRTLFDIVTNQIATIIALPESKRDKRRVFAEWKNGSRDWINRDDLREIWATSF